MKKLFVVFLLLFTLVACGVLGFSVLEDLSPIDALYMTIITISTVGFDVVRPLTAKGKLFTILLILSSVGTFTYALTLIANFVIEGQFGSITRRIRMEKNITALTEHYIVCGYSRIASAVIKDLKKTNVPFVVIINKEESEDNPSLLNVLHMIGDSTNDETLQHAMIASAKGLISCLETDKENLFVVISARSLNPELKIITVAKEETSFNKMLKAGADNVILPEVIGGKRMASMILQPSVLSFLDVMTTTREEGLALKLEEIIIPESSNLASLSLAEAKIPQKTGLLVVAIRKASGFTFNPSSSTVIDAKDTLIILGQENQVERLKNYACS